MPRRRRPAVPVAVLLLAVAATACTGDDRAEGEALDLEAPPPASAVEPADPVALGETVVVREHGDELALTLRRVVDDAPMHPRSAEVAPVAEGSRLVAVELAVVNRGDGVVHHLASGRGVLRGASGVDYAGPTVRSAVCPELGVHVAVLPGDSRVGCVTFQVAAGDTPIALQFRPGPGERSPTARWDLMRPPAPVPEPANLPVAAGEPVGATRSLAGSGGDSVFHSDATLDVAVTRVIDPAMGDEFGPRAGWRYVAVELTLANTSDTTWDYGQGDTSGLIGADGGEWPMALFGTPSCEVIVVGSTLEPGASRTGCIVFEVPEAFVPVAFQFAVDGGTGAEPGRWRLG